MKTPILILLITTSLMAWSQEGSYIIKREVYKNNLTSINFSPDGKYLFFTSTRSGNGDIYWVDAKIIDDMRRTY